MSIILNWGYIIIEWNWVDLVETFRYYYFHKKIGLIKYKVKQWLNHLYRFVTTNKLLNFTQELKKRKIKVVYYANIILLNVARIDHVGTHIVYLTSTIQ